jgi:hypothetical protein
MEPLPGGAAFLLNGQRPNGRTGEKTMYTFRKAPAKSVMFVVDYDDARRAYLWIDNPEKASDTRIVEMMARAQQEQGTLPEGTITSIRRVR